MNQQVDVTRVKELHKEAILAKPNVVGVGTGYKVSRGQKTDELCVVTLVRQKVPEAGLDPEALVPPGIDGVATDDPPRSVPPVEPGPDLVDRWRRPRPVPLLEGPLLVVQLHVAPRHRGSIATGPR